MAVYNVHEIKTAPGSTSSEPLALNDSGTVAGLANFYVAPTWRAMICPKKGSPTVVDPLPGMMSIAHGINSSGAIVGVRGGPTSFGSIFPMHGFARHHNGTFVDLQPLVSTPFSFANDINDTGITVGGFGNHFDLRVLSLNIFTSTLVDHGRPPGTSSALATGINAGGVIVGVSTPAAGGQNGFALRPAGYVDLGPAGDVRRINDSGRITGSVMVSNLDRIAAIYDLNAGSGWQQLGTLPGFTSSIAFDANDDGQVVGHCSRQSAPFRPFIWSAADGLVDLNSLIDPASGWVLETASSINASGEIAGTGTAAGVRQGYLLIPADQDFDFHVRMPDLFVRILFGVLGGGGGAGVTGGGHIVHIPPNDPPGIWRSLSPEQRDIVRGLVVNVLAREIDDRLSRLDVEAAALQVIERAVSALQGKNG